MPTHSPDVPEQYQQLVKDNTIAIVDLAEAIFSVVGELGCTEYECEGNNVLVKITSLGK